LWPSESKELLLEDLDQAVEALTLVSAEHARIVELRFMLGLTVEEAAASEGIAPRTVKRRWASARAWLQQWLEANGGD
jgi:DNA-directed RNA polymerase specialized sigma24 family protein